MVSGDDSLELKTSEAVTAPPLTTAFTESTEVTIKAAACMVVSDPLLLEDEWHADNAVKASKVREAKAG